MVIPPSAYFTSPGGRQESGRFLLNELIRVWDDDKELVFLNNCKTPAVLAVGKCLHCQGSICLLFPLIYEKTFIHTAI